MSHPAENQDSTDQTTDSREAPPKLTPWPQYVYTYFCSAAFIGGTVLLLRFALLQFGEAGLEELLVMRRLHSALLPLLSLSLAVSLAKLVPLDKTSQRSESKQLLSAGVQLSSLAAGIYLAIIAIAPDLASRVLFGNADYSSLLLALGIYLLGQLWAVCALAYCRGRLWNISANTINLACQVVVPFAVLFCVRTVTQFLMITGICQMLLLAILPLTALRMDLVEILRPTTDSMKLLLKAGLPRLLGDFSYYGMMALPALMMFHQAGITEGAQVSYGLTVLGLLMQLAAPINQFSLAETSLLKQSGHFDRLRARYIRFASLLVAITSVGVACIYVFAPWLIQLHLGKDLPGYVNTVRYLAPAAIPLNLYVASRGVADATYNRAVVPHLCTAALVLFLLASFLLRSIMTPEAAIIVAFHLSLTSLALTTAWITYRWFSCHATEAIAGDLDLPKATQAA